MARNPEVNFIDHLDPTKDRELMKTVGFFALVGIGLFAVHDVMTA